jgi:hypothetical protein
VRRSLPILVPSAFAVAAAFAGCGGENSPLASDEPIVVHGAVFKEGDLPGSPPLPPPTDPNADPDAGPFPVGTHPTSIESPNRVLRPGESGNHLNGLATDDAQAVALRFADVGTGYWVLPANSEDLTTPGQRTWSLVYDIGRSAGAGIHPLRVAAIDGSGASGTQQDLELCILRPVPDNQNACSPTVAPPFTVLSLAWDTDVDLDLVLVTPSGKIIDAKHPTSATASADAGIAPDPKKDGELDHDSNANCVIDGARREDVVWQNEPAKGTYLVYARLFNACGKSATRYTASLYFSETTGKNAKGKVTYTLTDRLDVSGEVLAGEANGGGGLGTYVTNFSIQ